MNRTQFNNRPFVGLIQSFLNLVALQQNPSMNETLSIMIQFYNFEIVNYLRN